jgi:virginiamycin B lyase
MMSTIRRLMLLVAIILVALPVSARAAIYWTGENALGLVNQDGSYPTYFWGQFDQSPMGQGCGVAVDSHHIYWADHTMGSVGRSDLDGTDAEYAFISGASEPCGVAVDGSYLYWANKSGTIGRARLDGTEVNQSFIYGLGYPCGVAVDSAHVYWTDLKRTDSIGRADLNGKDVISGFIEDEGACGVAVDREHVFWSTLDDSIGRANLDGSEANEALVSGLDRTCGVASDGSRVYWVEQGSGAGQISSATIGGSDIHQNLVDLTNFTHLPSSSCGIAADSLVFRPSPPQPGAHFEFGRVRHNYRKAQAFIAIHFPAAGSAKAFESAGLHARFLPEGVSSISLQSGGVKWLRISVSPKTKIGRHVLDQLKRSGKSVIGISLFYDEGGRAAFRTKAISLLRRTKTASSRNLHGRHRIAHTPLTRLGA